MIAPRNRRSRKKRREQEFCNECRHETWREDGEDWNPPIYNTKAHLVQEKQHHHKRDYEHPQNNA